MHIKEFVCRDNSELQQTASVKLRLQHQQTAGVKQQKLLVSALCLSYTVAVAIAVVENSRK